MCRLISFVGEDDSDIIPFFLEHYRKLGITEFHILLHGDWTEQVLQPLCSDDVLIVDRLQVPYGDEFKSSTIETHARRFAGEWLIFADADEFLELPFGSLQRTVAALCCLGVEELPATLLQRASADGSLGPLAAMPPDSVFPCYDYLLAERMIDGAPIWKSKYPLARIGERFSYRRGNHFPHAGTPSTHVAVRGVVHHFKWRDRLRRSILRRRGGGSNQHEQDEYLKWLEHNDFRVPTFGLRRYSRNALFQGGFLVRPPRDHLRRAAALRKIRSAPEGGPRTGLAPRGALPSAWPQKDSRAAAYLDRSLLTAKPGRIAIFTNDFAKFGRSAGIGTAMAALAERLAAACHEVHVFFCPLGRAPLDPRSIEHWESRGVRIQFVPRHTSPTESIPPDELMLGISRALSAAEWDVIHFQDIGGYASATLLERAADLRHQHTRIVVAMHGPTPWSRFGNHLPWTRDEALRTDLEAIAVRLADVVLCPSGYISDWCQRHYPSEAPHLVIPNSLTGDTRRFRRPSTERRRVNEIAYFGRIEVRKGVEVFLSAVQRVLDAGVGGFRVTLLGPIGSTYSLEKIAERTESWPCRVQVISNYGNAEAVDYLKANSCVAVIPSSVDNLPYTVYECLENGIPFIASGVGGIPELVEEKDRSRILVSGGAQDYADRLIEALTVGIAPATLSFDPDVADLDLLSIHAALVEQARRSRSRPRQRDRGKVTVIAYGNGESDASALERMLQLWRREGREVLSDLQGAIPPRSNEGSPLRSVSDATDAAACNRLARAASESLLLFCHASVTPALGALEALISVVENTDADAAICGFRTVDAEGSSYDVPAYAGPPELSASSDVYGAPFFLVRKRVIFDLGGFDEEPDLSPIMHWEFLNRARAAGYRITPVPSALALIRLPSPRIRLTEYQSARLAAPWVESVPDESRGFARMALLRDIGSKSAAGTSAAPSTSARPPETVEREQRSYTIQSMEDAAGMDFLVADAFLSSRQTEALDRRSRDLRKHVTQFNDALYWKTALSSFPGSRRLSDEITQQLVEQIRIFFGVSGGIQADRLQLVMSANGAFHPGDQRRDEEWSRTGQPDFLCRIFLSDDYAGGQLYFTSLDIAVQPLCGRLVAWTHSHHHQHAIQPAHGGVSVALQCGVWLSVHE
jgi:O-antigen biosynthesis protein